MGFRQFITKAIAENEVQFVEDFPDRLLEKVEAQLVKHLLSFSKDTGSLPTLENVMVEFENANILLTNSVPDGKIEQLFAKAKMSNFEREAKKIFADYRLLEGVSFVDATKTVNELWGLVSPPSKPIDYASSDTFVVPKSRYSFGYTGLEKGAGGLLDGEVALFAGQKKSRKTWITLDLALQARRDQGKKVYISSLEMRAEEIQRRLQALIGHFNPMVFRETNKDAYKLAKEQFETNDKILRQKPGQIIIPERMTRTVWDLRRDVEEYEPDIVFVDSIYRFKDDRGRPMTGDWAQLSVMANMLKDVARDYGVQIVSNTQLKRGANGADVSTDDIAYTDDFSREFDLICAIASTDQGAVPTSSIQVMASRNGPANFSTILTFDFNTMSIKEKPFYGKGKEDD